jgi:hypothetical protein
MVGRTPMVDLNPMLHVIKFVCDRWDVYLERYSKTRLAKKRMGAMAIESRMEIPALLFPLLRKKNK